MVNILTNKKNVNKEIIIETALRLIEENEGIKEVNLRGIAKQIGCAHTNVYNYFSSLDEIFWAALGQVFLKMIDYVDGHLAAESDPEQQFHSFLSNIIDFSMEHPGWYRLIWLESIGGEPPSEVKKILNKASKGFNAGLIKVSNNKLSEGKANFIGDILITYLHGELCKWINNRSEKASPEDTKKKILSNLRCLYQLLLQKEQIQC